MKSLKSLIVGATMAIAFVGSASALVIVGPDPINDLASGNPDPDCSGVGTGTDAAFIAASCAAMSGLGQVYKQDAGGAESGTLAGDYKSTFNATLSGGTIEFIGPDSLDCSATGPGCWLLIKDGNMNPGRYAYNLTGDWNGTDTIELSGFWESAGTGPDNGAISHWAFYGTVGNCTDPDGCEPDRVPEPATLALVGLALAGMGMARRRRAA